MFSVISANVVCFSYRGEPPVPSVVLVQTVLVHSVSRRAD